ncbi:hypothetical protein GCM10007938_36960 [Vibrio zhanjiangensis]|uniref:DUF3080 domain-containing protein n=1 Tax=Vibrio zhanjiangensis TaxID=1046128 RepID=A0ABQ6F313_9VIBR|nr:DUF3080 family protein [Vibrio zhanjiangensis]GLT19913.1 hypothetical protein GCM10007938_36960 [Vibrio zhanjiangensis]
MRIYVVLLSAAMLMSCDFYQDTFDQTVATYISRIANIQDRPTVAVPQNKPVTLPNKRTLLIEIPAVNIGFLDSYELRKCGLFSLIAQRNSILGKVQDHFRNYDYQITLTYGLNSCIESPYISDELKSQLADIQKIKQFQLPKHLSNLLFGSDAMRNQMQSSSYLTLQKSKESTIVLDALKQIDMALLSSHNLDYSKMSVMLTPYQEVLDKNPVIGKLSYSMLNTTQKLQAVTKQLREYDETIVCQTNRDRTQFNYLRNVFHEFFIEGIQPYLAQIDSTYNDLNPYLNFTENGHAKYQYPIRTYHQAFREASLAHVKYWQDLFTRCGVNPSP